MHARTRLVGALAVVLLMLSPCACSRKAPTPTASATSQLSSATAEPTGSPGPSTAPKNETAAQAAARLFPEVLDMAAYDVDDPGLLTGAKPGPPVSSSRTYSADRPTLLRWELPDETRAVTGNMFAVMRRVPVNNEVLLVPVTKSGRAIGEFPLRKDTAGYWTTTGIAAGSLPGGEVAALETATRKLQGALGNGTVVRATVFLPSGLAFAVGDHEGREAAVFLRLIGYSPGVGSYRGHIPDSGELLTASQLRQLFATADTKKPPATRSAPGGLD
jgi:hypothetical protein